MKLSIKLLVSALFLLAAILSLSACSVNTPESDIGAGIVVEDVWARQSPMAEGNGAAFMVIKNTGSEADTLVGANTDISDVVELHETIMEEDVMRMRPIEGQRLAIPAGGEVMLKPGGLHVMFIGLNQQLKPDDTFQVVLVFEKAGEQPVDVTVRKMDGMGDMDMGEMKKEGS